MTFNHLIRRLHAYLALLLLPWVLMYGISSFVINHYTFFQSFYEDDVPTWRERFNRPYDRPLPDDADLKQVGSQILDDLGLKDSFNVRRPTPDRLQINLDKFFSSTRVIYDIDEGVIRAEDRRFQWNTFLFSMHDRRGFQNDAFLHDAWAVMVDVASIGFIIFILSGLYMWWQLKKTRFWGTLALSGGAASFVVFLLAL